MSQRFSQELLEANRATWDEAINHRFVTELFEGTIDDAVMAGYLDQDYRFFEAFLQLLGAAITTADRLDARLRYASFAGEMVNSEDTYFQRAFDALGVTDELRASTPDTPSAGGFVDLMREAASSQNYSAVVAVLMVTECLYRDWAARAPENHPEVCSSRMDHLARQPGLLEFRDLPRTGGRPFRGARCRDRPRLFPPGGGA